MCLFIGFAPINAGKNEWWIFKTFPMYFSTKFGVKILIYFAKTISSGLNSSIFAETKFSCSSLVNLFALIQKMEYQIFQQDLLNPHDYNYCFNICI